MTLPFPAPCISALLTHTCSAMQHRSAHTHGAVVAFVCGFRRGSPLFVCWLPSPRHYHATPLRRRWCGHIAATHFVVVVVVFASISSPQVRTEKSFQWKRRSRCSRVTELSDGIFEAVSRICRSDSSCSCIRIVSNSFWKHFVQGMAATIFDVFIRIKRCFLYLMLLTDFMSGSFKKSESAGSQDNMLVC